MGRRGKWPINVCNREPLLHQFEQNLYPTTYIYIYGVPTDHVLAHQDIYRPTEGSQLLINSPIYTFHEENDQQGSYLTPLNTYILYNIAKFDEIIDAYLK